jgi:hypothetical protein
MKLPPRRRRIQPQETGVGFPKNGMCCVAQHKNEKYQKNNQKIIFFTIVSEKKLGHLADLSQISVLAIANLFSCTRSIFLAPSPSTTLSYTFLCNWFLKGHLDSPTFSRYYYAKLFGLFFLAL